MKVKTEIVMAPKTIYTYIAEDGKEFDSKRLCEEYEASLPVENAKVLDTAIADFCDFFSEDPMTLYNIENEDDWNILVTRIWCGHQNLKEYPGPGKYFAVREYCGDYPDEYVITEYDNYMSEVTHYYNSFYRQAENAYAEFNT